ncbi:MAG TPA: hypothetical protein VNV88_05700 [Candidatus Solibacter sp.]|jgi:hypothetical protein|nr:hypothetical protein [Candidatus Solibacter sp.]
MPNHNENDRVLSRMGARELTEQEIEEVSGGKRKGIVRPRCTLDPVTCAMDGICSPPPAC